MDNNREVNQMLAAGDIMLLAGQVFTLLKQSGSRVMLASQCSICRFPYLIDGTPGLLDRDDLPHQCPRHRHIEPDSHLTPEQIAIAEMTDGGALGARKWVSRHHDIASIRAVDGDLTAGDFRVAGRRGYYVQRQISTKTNRSGKTVRIFRIIGACDCCRQLFAFPATHNRLTGAKAPTLCPAHRSERGHYRPTRWTPALLAEAKTFGINYDRGGSVDR